MLYFAFGADMQGEALAELLGHPVKGRRARLPGFRLAFTARSSDWEGGLKQLQDYPGGGCNTSLYSRHTCDD